MKLLQETPDQAHQTRRDKAEHSNKISLGLMEVLKLGATLVTVAGAFFAVRGDVNRLITDQVATRRLIEKQDVHISTVAEKVQVVSEASELQLQALRNLGRRLYERGVIKSPEVAYQRRPAAAAPTVPAETDTAVALESEPEPDPKQQNFFIIRALKATGHAIAKLGGKRDAEGKRDAVEDQ